MNKEAQNTESQKLFFRQSMADWIDLTTLKHIDLLPNGAGLLFVCTTEKIDASMEKETSESFTVNFEAKHSATETDREKFTKSIKPLVAELKSLIEACAKDPVLLKKVVGSSGSFDLAIEYACNNEKGLPRKESLGHFTNFSYQFKKTTDPVGHLKEDYIDTGAGD